MLMCSGMDLVLFSRYLVGRPVGSLGLFQFYAIRVLQNDEMSHICTWKVRGKGLKCMMAWKLTLAQHH